jgi:hypothetical protein
MMLMKFSSTARCHSSVVVEKNVDAAELLRDTFHELFDCGCIGHIQRLGQYRNAIALADEARGSVQLPGVARAHGHFRAFGGEFFCCRARNTIARRSNNDITAL